MSFYVFQKKKAIHKNCRKKKSKLIPFSGNSRYQDKIALNVSRNPGPGNLFSIESFRGSSMERIGLSTVALFFRFRLK